MKRSLFLLASLMLTSAVYTHAEEPLFTPEQVLAFFSQYNPTVLEKAQTDQGYQTLVDGFVEAFARPATFENRVEIMAAVRNFDNSIRLHALMKQYEEKIVWARMAGQDTQGITAAYRQEVQDVVSKIFGVTLQVNKWALQEQKNALKKLRQTELDSLARQEREDQLKSAIKQRKEIIKSLKKNAGPFVLSATDGYVAQVEQQVGLYFRSAHQAAAQENSAAQSSNLQIKTNHKKPVAK